MIFIKFSWILLALFSPGFALGSDTIDTSKVPVKKSKLESEKENWSWLKEVDDWCRDDTISGVTQMSSEYQQEESSSKEKDKEDKPLKCPAIIDDPVKNYELYKIELNERFLELLSGRLPKELSTIVSELIHNDTEFEKVLYMLEKNIKARIKLLQTEEEGDYCEIVIKQKCRRDINSLVPRLQEFYDMILHTADEEKKIREKRENSLWILAENNTTEICQEQDLLLGDQLAETEVHDEF